MTCGQNLGNKGFSIAAVAFAALPPPTSSAVGAVEGKVRCHTVYNVHDQPAELFPTALIAEMGCLALSLLNYELREILGFGRKSYR